mgnify:CR=1 FL=1
MMMHIADMIHIWGLSDYNHLRKMLGYSTETLGKNEYILQMKQRVYKETGDFTDGVKLQDRGETLTCRKICTESFSQDGHNGGDISSLCRMNGYSR